MTVRPATPSRLAAPVARHILDAFAEHRRVFLDVTRRAKKSFEARDWARLRADQGSRLGLYRAAVDDAEAKVRASLGERSRDRLVWMSAKAVYSALIAARQDWDLAETFFNGVTRRIFDTVGVDPLVEFVASDFDAPPVDPERTVYRRFVCSRGVVEPIEACLRSLDFTVPWADLETDARLAAERAQEILDARGREAVAVDVLAAPFFRGNGAYVVARVVLPAGVVFPLVFALHHGSRGIFVDAVLVDEDDVSILFSFTRSYFHVEAERPYDVMRFLRSLIPKKRIAEIYIGIGEPKQGKTELYRAVIDHIAETEDTFGFAAGVPGLVMVVFTMPGMDVVMKVIRDHFPPEKAVTQARVRERYRWVYAHDRAGRLVDAQDFEYLALPKDRFEPDLLEELLRECGRSVRVEGDRLVFDLLYAEREVTPLNIFVRTRPQEEAEAALREWGEALRDLARENIFPGDLLLKNFGVTRHGRVALYDYDELSSLDEIVFRELPEAEHDEDELRPEPWFAVGPNDVFPEEFPRFLGLPRRLRPSVLESCADIFTARWWREVQRSVRAGAFHEPPPYPDARRLR